MARQMSKGQCSLCGSTFAKSAMTKHLRSCRQKEGNSETSSGGSPRKARTFHLVVEGRHLPDYWMHLDVRADARLKMLDSVLREIWLECCGHMSAFTIGGQTYSVAPMADFGDKSMTARLCDVLSPGMKFFHDYDFGTTTHLALKVVSQEERQVKGGPVRLLARNEPPSIPCMSCGKTATQVCTDCLWSGGGWLCYECAAEHECGEEMLLPVVNSPRVGMCGYTG